MDEIVCPGGRAVLWRRGELVFTCMSVVGLLYDGSYCTSLFCVSAPWLRFCVLVFLELYLTLVGQE